MQAIGEKGDEDVRFDSLLVLMMNRANRQITLEIPKRLSDFCELDVIFPQFRRIFCRQIAP